MNNNFKYNIQPRETKNGIVYDVFFYVVTSEGRKHKRLSGFKNKTLAKKAYTDFMASYIAMPVKVKNKLNVTFCEAFSSYLGAIQYNVKESTMYEITHIFKLHINDFFEDMLIAEIDKHRIIRWLDMLWTKTYKGKPYSQKTLLKIYSFFSSFYNWCVEHYEIENALIGVKTPKRRDNKEPRQIWTETEFERFIASVDDLRYKALFTTLFYSGCRIGELQVLTPADFNSSELHVHATYSQKTLDGSSYRITETKNYKSRNIPIPQKAIDVLNEWLNEKEKAQMPNKFIFGGENPPSRHAIQAKMETAIAKSGVKRIRIHDLRHSYVSLLMARGVNFGVIAALIGDTLDQVVKTYAHHVESDKLKAVALL